MLLTLGRLPLPLPLLLLLGAGAGAAGAPWRVCDVLRDAHAFGAPRPPAGDGSALDTAPLRAALRACDEVVLPRGATFLSGPLNLTSNQVLRVDGTLLAAADPREYPRVAPLVGYGWGNDENCFPPGAAEHKIVVGSLRYAPVLGAFHARNVTITGTGVIDGQGTSWWQNCTACHYPPHNDSSRCEIASRPKLVEAQFVDGLRILGTSAATPLTLRNSPFWTVTPSYSQNIHVANLHITAPMDRIGNTDGVNLDSCRNAVVENLLINNSDDGVCIKSGLNGFGLNLAIPTENVLVRNVTCEAGGRCGFAIGSEMSGGLRNVTYRDSVLGGSRGINIKPSKGRGGFIRDLAFENVHANSGVSFSVGDDGVPLMPGNDFVPLVSNLRFANVQPRTPSAGTFAACARVNTSKCYSVSVDGRAVAPWGDPLPPQTFGCKTSATTQFGDVLRFPWGVCLPLDAPVNLRPDYPNWGATTGPFASLAACRAACVVPGPR